MSLEFVTATAGGKVENLDEKHASAHACVALMQIRYGENIDRRLALALNTNTVLGSQQVLGASEELALNAAVRALELNLGNKWVEVAQAWENSEDDYKAAQLKWRMPWQK